MPHRNKRRHGDQKPVPFPVPKHQEHLRRIKRKLTQLINRKHEDDYRKGNNSRAQRKARTRTLIQLGGLIEKAGLLDFVELETGQDLQKDPATFEDAATLMGALLSLKESFQDEEADAQKILWEARGKQELAKGKQT